MPNESDVFISYAADLKPWAQELTEVLQKQGIQVWADFKDLRPGDRWHDELERAVEKADRFLILVGPRS